MQRFCFLDIDDVVLPHEFPNLKYLREYSGFSDWEKSSHKYMRFVSRELLSLVNLLLGEHIYWLTTWELTGPGANVLFCDSLDLPHYKELPYIGEYYDNVGGIWVANSQVNKAWWKAEMLDRFISELDTEDYKLLWIDNEINHHIRIEDPMVKKCLDIPQVHFLSPFPVLTRDEIITAGKWLNSE